MNSLMSVRSCSCIDVIFGQQGDVGFLNARIAGHCLPDIGADAVQTKVLFAV